jgi:hypothetical protein
MVDKLHTENDLLVTPNDRLTASANCCCPDCTICADDFSRTNSSNINTGAPFTWAGDTGGFTISGFRLSTVLSGRAITACSGDRVSVTIYRTNSGGSYSSSQATVKLGSITATITFPSSASEPGRLTLGGVSVGAVSYVDVPEITNRAQVTLCVRQVRPYNNAEIGLLGVIVYTAEGNASVSGYAGGTAFDPDAGTYGTSGIGTGTIDEAHSAIYFDNIKVQHLKGAEGDDLEDCPQCRPRPCFASSDSGLSPLATTEGKWYTYSGTWLEFVGPLTSYVAYSTLASDALKVDGNARGGWISCQVSPLSLDSNIRIYMTRAGAGSALSAADYVELVPPQGHDLGCVRLMRQTGVLAATTWNPGGNYPVTVYCMYGAGIWYVEVDGAASILIGPLSLQPFEPAIGLGSAPAPFAGGMELYSATIGHTAEEGYSYCAKHAANCQIYQLTYGVDGAATLPHCEWNVISGSWSWVEATPSTGHYYPATTSTNAYIQRQVPYPTLASGGCFDATVDMIGLSDYDDLIGSELKWGWDGGNSYVLIRFVDSDDYAPNQPRGLDLACPGEGHGNMGAFVAELWLDGSKVDEAGPYRACTASFASFRLRICLGEGVIRVTDGYWDYTLFRYELSPTETFGDNPYWGVGVAGLPAGVTLMVTTMELAHTSDQNNGYPPSSGPTGCEPCFTPYIISGSVCAENENLPTMVKAVVSGIINNGANGCDCPTLDGIYFLPPQYVTTRFGSGTARYGMLLEANGASSCTNKFYFLGVRIGTNFVNAGFTGDPFAVSGLVWSYTDMTTPPYSCLEDLVDLELPNVESDFQCITDGSSHFKVTTIR